MIIFYYFKETCFRAQLVQQVNHPLALPFGPHFDGGTSSYLAILLLNFWCSATGYPWSQTTDHMYKK